MALISLVENRGKLSSVVPEKLGTGRILITQSITTLVVSLAFAFAGFVWFYSAVLGGLACILPNSYAVWRVFGARRTRNRPAMGTLGVMLRAEFAKFVITAVIFALVFWLLPTVEPIALFTAFVIAMFAGWIEAGLKIQ